MGHQTGIESFFKAAPTTITMVESEELPTIADDLVVTKYKMSAEIVNKVLKELVDNCKVTGSVRDLCILGDKRLAEETGKAFKKDKKLTKGIAFPTCVSVNNCICHFSPLTTEPDVILADGDMVKIDMGAHIDGFIAVVAHTVVVGATVDNPVTGGKAVEGMLSHQLEQNKIDGEKTIIQNPSEAQRKEHDAKITVYKKTEDTYMLKMKTSREFYSKVSKQFGTMPFNLRSMEEEKKARMGVVECVTHKLIEPFQVLFDEEGAYVAQYKFTVLLMPNGPHKITGLPFDDAICKTEKSIEDAEIQKLLKTSANPKAAKKKKKAAEKAVTEETGAVPTLVAGQ